MDKWLAEFGAGRRYERGISYHVGDDGVVYGTGPAHSRLQMVIENGKIKYFLIPVDREEAVDD